MVEQLIRNQQVACSSHVFSLRRRSRHFAGDDFFKIIAMLIFAAPPLPKIRGILGTPRLAAHARVISPATIFVRFFASLRMTVSLCGGFFAGLRMTVFFAGDSSRGSE